MKNTDKDQPIEDTAVSTETTERRSKKKKSAPKIPTDQPEASVKTTEKKRKAPKAPVIESEKIDELKKDENITEIVPSTDQEVPVKPKKKRAPKIEINDETITTEQPIKKKKTKAPKVSVVEDDFQIIETPTIEELEPSIEKKPKEKKSKKSKKTSLNSLEDLQVINIDENYPRDSEFGVNTNIIDTLPITENDTSEYEKAILDSYNNLASKVSFSQYFGDDQWCIIHLPKTARVESKSLIRKMLPGSNNGGNNKEIKPTTKSSVPKGSLLTRIRDGVNLLVRDENNLIFGERSNYDVAEYYDEEDGIDTDDLHRYAQKLRELEDQDREVNPEFLVLRDGKTVYGVHESDGDGKVKIATRKPIYDRFADQKPDESMEKKNFLSRLKIPFTRNKDKDNQIIKSENSTPNPRIHRKSSHKSLSDDLRTMTNDDPLMI